MKLKYCLIALLVALVTHGAHASRDPGFETKPVISSCELTDLQRAVLNQKWNKLSMRFFMASMEKADDPRHISQVRLEVDHALSALRKEYGTDCVLDIL